MNTQEMKNQAHKEFMNEFREDIYKTVPTDMDVKIEKVKSFIDSIIDRTVQMTEERILQDLQDAVKHTDNIEMKTFLYTDQIKSLITNKSDINNPN